MSTIQQSKSMVDNFGIGYFRFGITRNDYYPIDPDGPLMGNEPISNDNLIQQDIDNAAPSHLCNALHVFQCHALHSTK